MKLLNRASDRSERSQDRQIRIFESEVSEINERRVPFRIRATLLLLAAMFICLTGATLIFRVDRVVTSSFGQIVITDPTVVIQPLDVGIVKSIDVKEGDRVKAGQALAELDPTFAAADVTTLEMQISSLDAEIARCEAELSNKDFVFDPGGKPGAQQYADLQKAYFLQRKAQYDSQVHAFDEQIAQANATIARLQNDSVRYADREKLVQELEEMNAQLVAKQLSSRSELLAASDQRVEMSRNLESVQNTIVETKHEVQSIEAMRQAFMEQWRATASQELVQARNSRDTAKSALDKAQRHQDVVKLTAPTDAIVLRLASVSVGSVIQQGSFFMELAPLNARVEGEIYIDPVDIGFVRPGDDVMIKLDAYNFVEHGWAEGKLIWISQGTFVVPDQGTGGTAVALGTSSENAAAAAGTQGLSHPFYKARVSITRVDLKNVPSDFELLPGLTMNADIHVGDRSLFWYLVRGMVRNYDESMREP